MDTIGRVGEGTGPAVRKLASLERTSDVKSFKNQLTNFLKEVNDLQDKGGQAVNKFVSGEITDFHQLMVAVSESKVSFELLVELRNKALEAYQEIMRMQV